MDPSSASVFDEAHDTGADAEPHPAGAIRIVQEAGQAIVAALHDVLRDAGQVEAWEAGHARRIALRVGPD